MTITDQIAALFAGTASLLFIVAGIDIGIAFLTLGIRGSVDERGDYT